MAGEGKRHYLSQREGWREERERGGFPARKERTSRIRPLIRVTGSKERFLSSCRLPAEVPHERKICSRHPGKKGGARGPRTLKKGIVWPGRNV